jgi:hypothetical protein
MADNNVAAAHIMSVAEVAEALSVRVAHGLPPAEVLRRRALHGFNELPVAPTEPLCRLVLRQFDDALVRILLAAAAVSLALALSDGGGGGRALAEPVVIVLILVLNALVGVYQETNAEKAIAALKLCARARRTPDAARSLSRAATTPMLTASLSRALHPRALAPTRPDLGVWPCSYEPDDAVALRPTSDAANGGRAELRKIRARELVPGARGAAGGDWRGAGMEASPLPRAARGAVEAACVRPNAPARWRPRLSACLRRCPSAC